jgi:Arabinose efflux permease
VLGVLAISVLGLLAVMSVYTYIAPLLAASAGVAGPALGALLLVYGAGSLAGNAVGGRLADRFGSRRPLLVVYPVFSALLATLSLTAGTVPGAAAALFLLGLVAWTTNSPLQSRLIEISHSSSGLALSLNAAAIYLGAGLSGVVGGVVISWVGVLVLPPVAAVFGLLALGLVLLVVRPTAATAAPEPSAPLR